MENTNKIDQTQEMFDMIKNLSSQINILNTSPNLENTQIKKYLDNFSLLKQDIDTLLKTKNPIWFILQLKKIKDAFFIHLENLVDFIEKELSTSEIEEQRLINDLWLKTFSSLNENNFWTFVDKKYDEIYWTENRINYRVTLRNDPDKIESYKLMDGFNQFRNIILNIEDSLFSDLYKVHILRLLDEKLSLKGSVYNNFKFFMLFILPKNYVEYCKLYTFFIEYEWYKKSKYSLLKLSILSIGIWFAILAYIFFEISLILWVWILLFWLWTSLKKHNFLSKKPTVRFHLSFHSIWVVIILFYTLMFLWNNNFFEVKVDVLDKVSNTPIVWQHLDVKELEKIWKNVVANILQSK